MNRRNVGAYRCRKRREKRAKTAARDFRFIFFVRVSKQVPRKGRANIKRLLLHLLYDRPLHDEDEVLKEAPGEPGESKTRVLFNDDSSSFGRKAEALGLVSPSTTLRGIVCWLFANGTTARIALRLTALMSIRKSLRSPYGRWREFWAGIIAKELSSALTVTSEEWSRPSDGSFSITHRDRFTPFRDRRC